MKNKTLCALLAAASITLGVGCSAKPERSETKKDCEGNITLPEKDREDYYRIYLPKNCTKVVTVVAYDTISCETKEGDYDTYYLRMGEWIKHYTYVKPVTENEK